VQTYHAYLEHLHEQIKQNPFRVDHVSYSANGAGYFRLIDQFFETFYDLIKDIRAGRLTDARKGDRMLRDLADGTLFQHELFGSATRAWNMFTGYELFGDGEWLDKLAGEEQMLELFITCIHGYLDSGYFLRYPYKSGHGIRLAVWDKDQGGYLPEEYREDPGIER
jgi:hypothetical protein